jgi:hypothetical protein
MREASPRSNVRTMVMSIRWISPEWLAGAIQPPEGRLVRSEMVSISPVDRMCRSTPSSLGEHGSWRDYISISITFSPTKRRTSLYALAGNEASATPAFLWAHGGTSAFHDVTEGRNGFGCPKAYSYICKARVGYDGPTGWGTPVGLGAL